MAVDRSLLTEVKRGWWAGGIETGRFDEAERHDLYQAGQAASRRSGSSRVSAGILLAVGVSILIYVAGRFPRAHPIVPALAFHLPAIGTTHSHMAPTTASFGSTFTISGTTHKDGTVRVDGRWNGGPWEPLATAVAVAGAYSVSFPITQHGTLTVRTNYPGGEADGTVLVP